MGNKRNSNRNAAAAADVEVLDRPETETVDTTDTAEVVAEVIEEDPIAAALALIDAETNGPVETEVTVDVVETEDEIAAAMAEIEDTGAAEEIAETTDEVIEEVEPDEGDVEAAIAELEADKPEPAPVSQEKGKSKSSTPRAPKAAPVPTREFCSVAAIDKTTLDSNLAALAAKKVNEKVANVIQAVETGKKLSRYTADAIKLLKSEGKVTGKSLVENFRSVGLSDGTARAQAQQMTALFKVLGIVMPDPASSKELVIADTDLVDELVKLAA